MSPTAPPGTPSAPAVANDAVSPAGAPAAPRGPTAFVVVDAGDTFSDQPTLTPDRVANAKATALLIIDRFNAESVAAQAVGDRDLALGRANLQELAARARYPFVTTNLIDTVTGKPLFEPFALIDVGHGVKVAFLGLIDPRNVPPSTLETERVRVDPPELAARAAVDAAKARGASMFVVLSQLPSREEERVGAAVPELQLFLGGDAMGMMPEIGSAAAALSLPGSQKGKHLGLATLSLADPLGAGRGFFDPNRRADLERKKRDAEQRIETYDRLLAEARARLAEPPPTPAPPTSPAGPNGPRRPMQVPSPTLAIEAYERQLVAARAESQLAATALAELPADEGDAATRNQITFELIPLSRDVTDEPTVQKAVEEHRTRWPDPTPGH